MLARADKVAEAIREGSAIQPLQARRSGDTELRALAEKFVQELDPLAVDVGSFLGQVRRAVQR